jgi:hypothetical protein
MGSTTASFWRDANRFPITTDGIVTSKSLTTNATNTTVNPPIFTVTGVVEVRALWGVVTTTLGSNQTAAYWRLNDQTAQVAISLATGTTMSNSDVGSIIQRTGVAATALTLSTSAAGRVTDTTSVKLQLWSPFTLVKKLNAVTQIEYVYTTNQSPTTGAIQFFCRWLPLSADGSIDAA